MTVCDSCKAPAKHVVKVTIEAEEPARNEARLDFCDDCFHFISINNFLIGVTTVRLESRKLAQTGNLRCAAR